MASNSKYTKPIKGGQKLFDGWMPDAREILDDLVAPPNEATRQDLIKRREVIMKDYNSCLRTLQSRSQEWLIITASLGEKFTSESTDAFSRSIVLIGDEYVNTTDTVAGMIPVNHAEGFTASSVLLNVCGLQTSDPKMTHELVNKFNAEMSAKTRKGVRDELRSVVSKKVAPLVERYESSFPWNDGDTPAPSDDEIDGALNVLGRAAKKRRLSMEKFVDVVFKPSDDTDEED
jgi:hypothetical protein